MEFKSLAIRLVSKTWLLYAMVTAVFWGIWGAFIEIPEKSGFPATLGYCIWAITMIPCSLTALWFISWKLEYDKRSMILGSIVGLLGAAGQLILFQALRDGPAYVVFPLISLFPIVTIFLSSIFLKEKASPRQWTGIAIALIAIFFLSYQAPSDKTTSGSLWLILTILVFIMWGIQAFFMKFSNNTMKAESIFFYMMVTGLSLIPIAVLMTDFSKPINLEMKGPYLAFLIHLLNSVGALTLVYAIRYGKSIIVVPLTGLSPIITVILSLIMYAIIPGSILAIGVFLAMIAIFLLSE